ncbi:MAG TPA: glycosyl hydrolase, partial [Bryobacteraceae bacterium]
KLVREVSSKPKKDQGVEDEDFGPRTIPVPAKEGLNRYVWNLRYDDAAGFPGLLMWDGSLRGPIASPGDYRVEVTVNGKSQSQNFTVIKDPRAPTTQDDFDKQLAFALKIRDRVTEANQSVIDIRAAKDQLKPYLASSNDQVKKSAKDLTDQMTTIEEAIYQTKLKAGEDALNFPIKLNNKLAAVENTVEDTDVAPTAQSYEVYDQLSAQLKTQLDQLHQIETTGIDTFNKLVRDQSIPAITIPTPKKETP